MPSAATRRRHPHGGGSGPTRAVLHGEPRLRLDLPEEKLRLLDPLGIQQLVLVPFNRELARLMPAASWRRC